MSAATSSDSSTPPTSPGAMGQRAAGAGASDDVLGAPPAIDDTAAVQSTGTAPAPAGDDAPAAKRHKASEEEQLDTDAAGPPADLHVAPGASQPQQQPPSIGAIDAPPMPQVMPGHQLMVVTCPAGVDPGSIVRSQEPGGASFDVAVPVGVGPGQKFYVQVQTGGSATIEPPWTACYTAAGDGSNHQPGQLYYVNLVTKESRWDPPTSSSSTAAVMSTTAIQTEPAPTATIATQTIQLLGGAADTAPVPAASPSAASGHSSGSTSPPVSPLEPPVIAPPPTREHAAIAAIESRLAPHEQEKAALLAQQELIKEQRKELNRQMALIRERLEAVKPKLLPGQQELRGRKSYLQLLVDQPKSETDTELRAAQSRMALACGGLARLGLTALLQNIDIFECVAKHVATAVVERRKLVEFGQAAANARKQLQFGMKLEWMPAAEYNGIYKVDHERLGAPVLKNEHGKYLFWRAKNRMFASGWFFTLDEPPAPSADQTSGTQCRAHTPERAAPQVNAGHLPEGSQTWNFWSTESNTWEETQLAITVFRTEIQAADTEKADKAAIEVQLNKEAAAATAQLAGVDQIVVSGLPAEFQDGNGIYYRKDDMHGFPVFKLQCAVDRYSFWLLYSTTLHQWGITQLFVAGAKPDKGNSARPNTARSISSSSDGTLDIGSNAWNIFGRNIFGAPDGDAFAWHNKMITVTPQQSSN
eukprot:COSAG06_NODE_2612_length_6582_cov_2.890791_4_plen_701_part_00